MTERTQQLHQDNVLAHFVALVQAFLGQKSRHPGLSVPLTAQIWLSANSGFPKAKITFASKEICGCDGHTIEKLIQRRLTAN
jgi:hypothetical protein